MIPILFTHSESSFTTNGLGRLVDATSCLVTEELNGIFELTMVYPVSGQHYDELTTGRLIYATHDDRKDPQPFEIYRKTAPLNGLVTFYARHISYRLNNVIVNPFDAGSCTEIFDKLTTQSINNNPFTFNSTVTGTKTFEIPNPRSVRSILLGSDDMAIPQMFGGEYQWDKFTVRHMARRGSDTAVELRYGKNLTDLTYDQNAEETYTAVIPYWLSGDGAELAMLPERMITKSGYTSEKAQVLDMSQAFDVYPEESDLRDEANRVLQESHLPVENIDVKFWELWQTEEYAQFTSLQRCFLGDTVKVIYPDIDVNISLRVVKVVYDTLLDRYDSMELGKPKETFAASLTKQFEEAVLQLVPTKSAMQQAIEHATELITGGLGGYVIIGTNADGQPNEILIMDDLDKEEAVNVIRMNNAGIGFSTTGYNGPFTSAWTIDGHFNADFITAGTLTANLIRAGIIADTANKNSWNLDTGALVTKLATIGGLLIREHEIYTENHSSISSTSAGFYANDSGEFSIGDGTNYIKFYQPIGETDFKFEARLDSLLLGPSGTDIEDAIGDVSGDIGDAAKTATNYLYYSSSNGLVVSETGTANGTQARPFNTQIVSGGINLRNRSINLVSLDTTGIRFFTPNGNTLCTYIGASGLEVKRGIIGGYAADENSLIGYYTHARDTTGTPPKEDRYVARINKPSSLQTKVFKIADERWNEKQYEEIVLGPEYEYSSDIAEAFSVTCQGMVNCTGLQVKAPNGWEFIKVYSYGSSFETEMDIGCIETDKYNITFSGLKHASTTYGLKLTDYLSVGNTWTGTVGVDTSSSKRYKDHVRDMSYDYARGILDITPVIFKFKEGYLIEGDEAEGKEIPGFYAEDVEEHFPMGVCHTKDGLVENWKADRVIPVMLKVMQEQEKRIETLEERLAKLESLVAKLKA